MSAYTPELLQGTARAEADAHARRNGQRVKAGSVRWIVDVTNGGATLAVSYFSRTPGAAPGVTTGLVSIRVAL